MPSHVTIAIMGASLMWSHFALIDGNWPNTEYSCTVNVWYCDPDTVAINVSTSQVGGIVYIPTKTRPTPMNIQLKHASYNFSLSTLGYEKDIRFMVVVQRYSNIQTVYDKYIPVRCSVDTNDVIASEKLKVILPTNDIEEPTFLSEGPSVDMSIFSDSELINSGSVVIGSKVWMEISIEKKYQGQYAINVKECTASDFEIVKDSCPIDRDIFPGFNRFSHGAYMTQPFPVFRPNKGLQPEASIVFSCRVSVCRTSCHVGSCSERTPGYGRRKRESGYDAEEIIKDVVVHAHLRVRRSIPTDIDINPTERQKKEGGLEVQICMDTAAFIPCILLVIALLVSLSVTNCRLRVKNSQQQPENDSERLVQEEQQQRHGEFVY